MVASRERMPKKSELFFNSTLLALRMLLRRANEEARQQGLEFLDATACVNAAMDIALCEQIASSSLAAECTDPASLPTFEQQEARLDLAQEVVGEKLRDAIGEFVQICKIARGNGERGQSG
jgi:hypothetical protein